MPGTTQAQNWVYRTVPYPPTGEGALHLWSPKYRLESAQCVSGVPGCVCVWQTAHILKYTHGKSQKNRPRDATKQTRTGGGVVYTARPPGSLSPDPPCVVALLSFPIPSHPIPSKSSYFFGKSCTYICDAIYCYVRSIHNRVLRYAGMRCHPTCSGASLSCTFYLSAHVYVFASTGSW